MALNYDEVMSNAQLDIPFSYTDADTMLYALCIGMGRDPLNTRELPYVYELGGEPRTVPTLATVLVPDMFPPDLGWTTARCCIRSSACSSIDHYRRPQTC